MSVRKALVAVVLVFIVSAFAPAKASADWMLTPFVGITWGSGASFNDAIGNLDDEFETRGIYGASLTWMGAGVFGAELDFGWAPNFFQSSSDEDFDYGDNNVTTLMGNLILGIPIGGQTGGGVRPYVTGGVGLIKAKIDDPEDLIGDLDSNEWGYNVGGGIKGFFTDKVGIRGDVRYFRQFSDIDVDPEGDDVLDVTVGKVRFWRGSIGVIFRF